ncbi:hypothetical protein Daus18300_007962 [Diaporthe australafricana]|uniref:Heterokaryon incompatibility domain-containing protein n=1 Tax=Diaporthe australafricana TaxID=127596 RepID=A0ABR3WKI7_9PEZI
MSTDLNISYPGRYLEHEDSFRLLELLPGQQDSPLAVRLLTSNLHECPPYEALSYAWGDLNETEALRVFAHDPEAGSSNSNLSLPLSVTCSCARALRRLRFADAPRILWVDSICIDQSRVIERNHQLYLMARIYSGAARVVVYLGESDDDASSDTVIDWLRDLHEPSGDAGSAKSVPPYDVIMAFLGRRWFTRTWVLQEIRLSKAATVVCGDREVDWEAFLELRHWFNQRRWKTQPPFAVDALVFQKDSGEGWFTTPSYAERLLRMLQNTRELNATDPRDKLFALLPLLEWEDQQHDDIDPARQVRSTKHTQFTIPKPDYNQTTAETFTKLARSLLEVGLNVLYDVETPTKIPDLPSWAPDWSIVSISRFHGIKSHKRLENALPKHDARDVTRKWTFSDFTTSGGIQSTQLHIRAAAAETIVKIGELCDVNNGFFPMKQWESLCDPVHLEKCSVTQEMNLQMQRVEQLPEFVKTLFCAAMTAYADVMEMAVEQIREMDENGPEGLDTGVRSIATGDKHSADLTSLKEEVKKPKAERMAMKDIFKTMGPSYQIQAEHMFHTCHGRRFFVTDAGNLGLAPKASVVGDRIMEIEGVNSPFVVKLVGTSNDGSQIVRLVGSCHTRKIAVMPGQGSPRHPSKVLSDYVEVVVR